MKKLSLILFLCLSLISYAKFEKIEFMESKIYGFKLANEQYNFEERINNLEEKVMGRKGTENVFTRESKLYNLLFLDGKYYSINTKVNNLEDYLFKGIFDEKDFLTRIENIETYLYNEIDNNDDMVNRINKIYKYLLLKDSDFVLKAKFLKKQVGIIEIKLARQAQSLTEGSTIVFNLEKEIPDIAEAGSKVIGEIVSYERNSFFKDDTMTIILSRIKNKSGRDIDIYKKIEIKGNEVKFFIGGKKVNLRDMLIIG